MISLRISLNSSFFPFVFDAFGFLYLSNKDLRLSCSFLSRSVTFIVAAPPTQTRQIDMQLRFPSGGRGIHVLQLCRSPGLVPLPVHKVIQLFFGLFTAVSIPFLQLADELLEIALYLTNIVVREFSALRTD